MSDIDRYSYDVVVVGAGGSGLRAAIEARLNGKKTAIISKSLFGKAHTVMAEGGCAAAMGNVNPNDNWQVHYRDTMRGGKFLNNWRMAELHAQEAPDRVWELEAWGAVFDRTKDGKISQRNFGGHEYPRLAHVGDRTGLEMIRSLQQKVVAMQQADAVEFGDPEAMIKVYAETTVIRLIKDGSAGDGRIAGAFGYFRDTGRFVFFEAPAVVLATGGIGKTFKVTSNSWEYTGDGHALALLAGATLLNMEFVQFHPTHMVWPLSVAGLLVTESVRGDGGVLRNSEGKRFMFNYVPDVFRPMYAETEEEADRWYNDQANNRRPPELLPRDEVARSIRAEVKAGRGSPHGGVFLDIASRRPAEEILRKLPSMYHQFKELADVDITKEPMEVGPAQHYVMGGVEVDPDSGGHALHGASHRVEVAQIALDDLDALADRRQVVERAARKVVQNADPLAVAHQRLGEVGSDEAGAAGDQIHRSSVPSLTAPSRPSPAAAPPPGRAAVRRPGRRCRRRLPGAPRWRARAPRARPDRAGRRGSTLVVPPRGTDCAACTPSCG